MNRFVIGILAHVDAGKTTLSEALLCCAGEVGTPGRVDHKNAFLDTHPLERSRGITIFSKPAVLHLSDAQITLLDTPGHMDFSAETERAIRVLDAAVLVISGSDGVQSHTETLWRLLRRYKVPTFIFINKMDLPNPGQKELVSSLAASLGEGFVNFDSSAALSERLEDLSLCSESLLCEYLKTGLLCEKSIASAVSDCKVFPCYFGSALQLSGAAEMLDGICRFFSPPKPAQEFGAKVYKITQDDQGGRLSWLKITGGSLAVRQQIEYHAADGSLVSEKVSGLRIYSGAKGSAAQTVFAGEVCAVTGLSRCYAGQGLGSAENDSAPVLEPIISCSVLLPESYDLHKALTILHQLEDEDPALRVRFCEGSGEIQVQLMGSVQQEILQSVLDERFSLAVQFGPGKVLYKETIVSPVEGVGHYEPLRHYAEVHLVLKPLPRASGLRFRADCSEDSLDRNWQRLILTHLAEAPHPGVLTGSPITDMEITLIAGKAHLKHTEGGDFRQATYRALRQGLRCAQSLLLEPWYEFKLSLPTDCVGRALSDLQRMSCTFEPPLSQKSDTLIKGRGPAVLLQEYQAQLVSYTRGRGRLFCSPAGYEVCHDSEKALKECGYDPDSDTQYPADSIFCSHGAGVLVKWQDAAEKMHIKTGWGKEKNPPEAPLTKAHRPATAGGFAQDKELLAIFERTYGPVRRDPRKALQRATEPALPPSFYGEAKKEYLLVDGYNVIFANDEMAQLARENLDLARNRLCDILCNYQGYRGIEVIAVFDAYKIKGNPGSVETLHNIHVVYTKEAETADMYIEKVTRDLGRHNRVRVATSDGLEQLIILGHGAFRLPASLFWEEMSQTEKAIRQLLENSI